MSLAGRKFLIGMLLMAMWGVVLIGPNLAFSQQDQQDAKEGADKPFVLKNARIHSLGPKGTFNGSVVVVDGKISAIGAEVESPDDAQVYDLNGFHITPGLIDSRSKLWISDAARAENNSRCELNIVDAIDPWSEDWKELASQGITSVYTQPASGGLIGGYGAVLRVGPYTDIDDIVLKEQVAVQAAIGVRATSTSQARHTLYGQLEKLLDRTKKEMEKEEKKKKAEKEKKDKKDAKKSKTSSKDSKAKKDKTEDAEKDKDKQDKDDKDGDEKEEKNKDKDDKEKKKDAEEKDNDKKKDKDSGEKQKKKDGKEVDKDKEKKDEDKDEKKEKGSDKGEDKDKKKDKDADKKKDDKKDKDGDEKDKKDGDKKSDEDDAEKPDRKLSQATIALRKVLKKELPLFIEVRHSDTLAKALKLAEKFDIEVMIDGVGRTQNHLNKLVEADIPMVVGPLFSSSENSNDWSGSSDEPLAMLKDSLFSISGFAATPRSSRMLRSHAAMALRMGLDHEAVLAAITSRPARALGVSDQVGTLEVGKLADIAVFNGDPLDPCSQARLVLSQGRVAYESTAEPMEAVEADAAKPLPARLPKRYAVKTTRMLQAGKFTAGHFIVDDSKIVSIDSKGGETDDDIQTFDLGDTIVTPGLVIASSMLGQETAIVDAFDSDTSHLRAVDAIDPAHKKVKQVLHGGFIHVGISPGTTNASPGVMGHVRLSANDYVASPTIASQFVLTGSARVNGRYPSSFNGQLKVIGDLMAGKPLASNLYLTPVMKRLLDQEKVENVSAVVKGDRRAVIAADSHLEIRSAIALAKEQGITAALHSNGRVGEFAEQLAENKLGLIVPTMNGGEYDAQINQIVMAQQAGVPIGFAGDSPEAIRLTAALLVSHGLDAEAALLGLTEGGGQIVGMKQSGLEKGAFADFVVWSDSPLNLAARPLSVVVDGQVVTKK